ncbi:uncharacterized protein PV09_04719 [Verruconis gallopava]|uniref:Dolichol phosphate-mannose biosynthesis regulatory protein n=1 Tax=Verruconis gallopava TaxID=253628 RepID=A0A0D2AZA4_9PEZI|nr:uncharacterized protein PV09_04719 [Verruconis gallopava]KIW04454.1 hypothetical protein PV09_04719 [Verruconis gallopava]
MAWEFLSPILTPNALATVQANPILLAYLLGWIGALIALISVAVAIHIQTSKAYKKPKKTDGKGGAPPKPAGIQAIFYVRHVDGKG